VSVLSNRVLLSRALGSLLIGFGCVLSGSVHLSRQQRTAGKCARGH
jgi:hypothetical protein